MGAYFEMFKRDHQRMRDIYKRMNLCPLGSGALAGTTYPLDREYTALLLGFDGPTFKTVWIRCRTETIWLNFCLPCQRLWCTLADFRKKWSSGIQMNTNLLRLTTLTVREAVLCRKRKILISQSLYEEKQDAFYGALTSLLTTMKGIPLAYNKRYAGR
mgnify:CR=1 FL=1